MFNNNNSQNLINPSLLLSAVNEPMKDNHTIAEGVANNRLLHQIQISQKLLPVISKKKKVSFMQNNKGAPKMNQIAEPEVYGKIS